MNLKRFGKKAAKSYVAWKGIKALSKVAAVLAASWGAYHLYQQRRLLPE